jgi:hypothetical protein
VLSLGKLTLDVGQVTETVTTVAEARGGRKGEQRFDGRG